MVSMEQLRKWALTDPSQDDELKMALAAAEGYLLGADVPVLDDPVRDMALLQLSVYFFEQRAPGAQNTYAPMPPALPALILQLRHGPKEEGAKA